MASEVVQRPPSSPQALLRVKNKDTLLPSVAASAERISAFLHGRTVITPGSALIKSAQLPAPREPSLAERSRSNYTLVEIQTTTTGGGAGSQQQRGRRRNNESPAARAPGRGGERTATSTRHPGGTRTVTVADVDDDAGQPHLSPHRSPTGLLRSAASSWRRSVHGGDEDYDPRNLSGASDSYSDDNIATSTATFFLSMDDNLMSASTHSRRRLRAAGSRPTRSPAEEKLMAAMRNKIEMANAIVSETFAGPPPHVRTEAQRHQELLSKEHAKIILLSGRIANLQSRAEDVIDAMAVVASETRDEQNKPGSASSPTTATTRQTSGDHDLAAGSVTSSARSPLRRKRTGLDVRASPSPSLEDTLRGTRHLTQQFLKEGIGAARCAGGGAGGIGTGGAGAGGSGAGGGGRCGGAEVDKDFNVARLHELVDRLTENIAVLERSVDGGVPEAASAQRRRELLETVSNLKDMYWLIESLDHVLISAGHDTRHTPPLFLTDTPYITGDPTRPGSGQRAMRGSLVSQGDSVSSIGGTFGGSADDRRGSATRPPRPATTRSAEARRSRSLALPVPRRTDTATAAMGASGADDAVVNGATDKTARRADSEPSMVPFSLHGSSTMSALLPAGASRLQLLDFMFDAIAEQQAAALRVEQARHARRPITAPLAVPLYEHQRAALAHPADQVDTEGKEDNEDEQAAHEEGEEDDGAGNDVNSVERNGESSGQRTSRGITSATGRTSSGGSRDSARSPFAALPPSPHGLRAVHGRVHSLRPEFFDGLRRMYKDYDYPQLLDAAHRASLSRGSRKSQEAYVLEMAAKLENFHHRASQAAPVELDELEGWSTGRPTTRGARSSFDGTSSLSRGSQGRATASLQAPGSRATSAHERRSEAEAAGGALGWSRPPTASATAPFVCAQEAVLLLERLQDGIVFSVVGEMSADSVARYEQASPDERRRRSSSGVVYDRYTVRVRNEVAAGHATPACDTLATVQVLRERLRNLTVQAAEGVAARMSLGHASFQAAVGPGTTRVLCTLHPVMAGRASGFERAFVFAQEADTRRASTPASGQRGFDSFNSLQPVVRGEGDDDALSISSGAGSGKEEGGRGAAARPMSRASTTASRGSKRGVAGGKGRRKAGGGVVLLPRGVATRHLGQKRHSSVAHPEHRGSGDVVADTVREVDKDATGAAATRVTTSASAAQRAPSATRAKPPLAAHTAVPSRAGSGSGGAASAAGAGSPADAAADTTPAAAEEGGAKMVRGMSLVSIIERPASRQAEAGRQSRKASFTLAAEGAVPLNEHTADAQQAAATPPPLFAGEPRPGDMWGATREATQEEAMEKNYIALSAMQVGAAMASADAAGGVADELIPMGSHLTQHAAQQKDMTAAAAAAATGELTRRHSVAAAMATTMTFAETDAVAEARSSGATASRAASPGTPAADASAPAAPRAGSSHSPQHRPSTSMHGPQPPRVALATPDKTAPGHASAEAARPSLPQLRTPSPAGAVSPSPRLYRGGSLPPPTIVVSSAQSRPLRSKEDVDDYAAVGVIHWDVTDDEREAGARPPTAATAATESSAAAAAAALSRSRRSDITGGARRTPTPSGPSRGGTPASRTAAGAASRRSTMGSPGIVYDVAEEGLPSGLLPTRMQLPEITIHRSGDTGNINVLLPVGVDFVQDLVHHHHHHSYDHQQQQRTSEAGARPGAARRSTVERSRAVFRQSLSLSLSTGAGVQQQRSSLQTQAQGGSIDDAVLADPSARRAHSLLRAVTRSGVVSRSGGSVGSSVAATGRLSQGRTATGSLAETGGNAPSEMALLEQEARELFMQDPLRYDDVIDELLQFAVSRVNGQPATPPQSASSQAVPALPSPDATLDETGAATTPAKGTPSASTTQIAEMAPGADALVPTAPSLLPPAAAARQRGSQTARRGSTVSFATLNRLSIGVPRPASLSSLDSESVTEKRASSDEHAGDAVPRVPAPPQRRQSSTTLQKMEELAKMAEGHVSEEGKTEIERILYEQMKAKLILRIMIAQMRALWAKKQREQDEKRNEALTQALQQAMQSSWTVERSRIVNLQKLITILDRRVQRVHGWLPFYSDDNVLVDPDSEYCPRYLRLLPQRRLVHAMYLAKRRRLLPLRLLRTELMENWNKHLLFGYRKQVVPPAELVVEGRRAHKGRVCCGACGCRRTTGERMRYRRRLLRAAPFQAPSKMYSPRLRWEADLPFAQH